MSDLGPYERLTEDEKHDFWVRRRIEEHNASKAAKPAEDGLEAQLLKECRAFIDSIHPQEPTSASYRLATLIAARERELREKLLELAESTDDLLNTVLNSRTFAQRERVAKAVADARALLASHWPAQKESK